MIFTKNSAPQEKTQILRPSLALKVSSKQANPEVLELWYSTIFNIEKYHFLHSQTFLDIEIIRTQTIDL